MINDSSCRGNNMQRLYVPLRRWLWAALLLLGGLVAASPASSGPQDPLPAGVKVLRSGSVSVTPAGASGSDIFTPIAGTFILDYQVEAGKQIIITMITAAQYRELAAGRKVSGQPVMKAVVDGTGRQSVVLQRGNYFLAFNNNQTAPTVITFRAALQAR
jgi:hypothetical protein